MNDHTSINSKGLRTILLEKFHHRLSHSRSHEETAVAESQEQEREHEHEHEHEQAGSKQQQQNRRSSTPSPASEDGDVEMDINNDEYLIDISTEKSSIEYGQCFSETDERKTGPAPLTLNTDANTWYAPENRVCTPVMTPVNQSGPAQFYSKRHDSMSSLASSVSEFGYANMRPQSAASNCGGGAFNASFTPRFVSLLSEVYVQVCSDPTITPFDSNNPPSGILHRVSKIAVEKADAEHIDIGIERNSWLLTLVRQRLLMEARKESYLSRNSSIISLPPVPQFGIENISAPFGNSQLQQQQQQQDYFNCSSSGDGSVFTSNNNYYMGINSSLDSRPSSQSYGSSNQQLQQPIQMSQTTNQLPPQHPKSLVRSRNNSFLTAASRSRSNSFKVHPQLSNTMGSVQSSSMPKLSRSRSTSNAHFVLTPTNSIPSQPSFLSQSTSAVNTVLSAIPTNNNTTAAGQQVDERNARLPTHVEN